MDTEKNTRLIEVFNAALVLPPEEQAAYLAAACGDDESLRREVESLLAHAKPEYSKLDVPAVGRFAKELLSLGELDLAGQEVKQYLIREEIGRGGMGQVFKAYDQKLKRDVAIKFLPPDFFADVDRVRRFEQEARAASALNHPNIITIHDIEQHDGLHFIVMEYVAGQTLRTRLQAGKRSSQEAVDIAVQIADALAAAHYAGIIHRDIKPENIILREDGRVKVLDFGIAKLGEEEAAGSRERQKISSEAERKKETDEFTNSPTSQLSATSTSPVATALGSILGTVNYMSPEQANGGTLNGQADVFSLGQVLLEMVMGKHLLAGQTSEDVLQLLRSDKEPLATDYKLDGMPQALEPIVRKSLKRNLNARYKTAQEMLDDLKRVQRRTATKWLRRLVVTCAVGILLLLGALGLAVQLSTVETWTEKVLRDGHTLWVHSVAFSPDGKTLVSASEDKTVIVWDFAQRKRLKTLTEHTDRVNAVAFARNGKWFATSSNDKTVMVWDAATFERIATLREHRDTVQAVAFSPDGKWLASASSTGDAVGQDFRTVLWDTSRWTKAGEVPYGVVYGPILFSPDSRSLITNQVQWDLVNETQIVKGESLPNEKRWGGWNWAALSPDAKLLVSTGGNGEVAFWKMSHPADVAHSVFQQEARAHQNFGRAVAFSPDGKLVATGTDVIILWDAATKQIVSQFDGNSSVWNLAFSPDGQSLVSAHGDGSIYVWDMNKRRRTTGLDGHGNHVLAVAYSPDGKCIASAGKDGAVIVWNAATEQKEATLFSHETRVLNLAFSPDGKWLASFDQDGYLIRWDLEKMTPQWKVKAHNGSECLTVSPDGKWLMNPWAIYESSTGREYLRWDQMQKEITMTDYAAFSPDGENLAVVGGRKLILLATKNWQLIAKQETAVNLTRVAFSPDGHRLITGSENGTLTYWESATLRKIAEIQKHKAAVSSVVFSPDGKIVASADKDEIALWDASSRKRIHTISAQAIPVYSLAFAPDGKRLVAGKRDAAVRMYTFQRMRWGKQLE